MPVSNPGQLDAAVASAVGGSLLVDKRHKMPRGKAKWPRRLVTDIVGQCVHHSGGPTMDSALPVARYHTSPDNHITPGEPLPSITYDFAITNTDDPVWLVSDLLDRKYAQGRRELPGDENIGLISILVLGTFTSAYATPEMYPYALSKPSKVQLEKLVTLTKWLQETFGYENNALFAHSDFGKPACPGDYLSEKMLKARSKAPRIETQLEAQEALLAWNPQALPRYGADGHWGSESKGWLVRFQRANRLQVTGILDPFTLLKLYRIRYPYGKQPQLHGAPQLCTSCGEEVFPSDKVCKGPAGTVCPIDLY